MKNNGKERKFRDGTDGCGVMTRSVDRRSWLPRPLKGRSIYEIWGKGGPGPLLSKLGTEPESGDSVSYPLNRGEIAQLVELFKDEPLPDVLRDLVLRELRGERQARPGPKYARTVLLQIEHDLFPSVYETGLRVADRARRHLVAVEKRKKRWERPKPVPTRAAIAACYVRQRLPSMRMLSDKSIANALSARKDAKEKKPRAKRTPR